MIDTVALPYYRWHLKGSRPNHYPKQLNTLGDHLKLRRLELGVTQWAMAHRLRRAATERPDFADITGYGRYVADATLSTPIWRYAHGALRVGRNVERQPSHSARLFVGGLHTVRGQLARLDSAGRVVDAFWLGRGELGFRNAALRPVVFYDVGWAGSSRALGEMGEPCPARACASPSSTVCSASTSRAASGPSIAGANL